MRGVRSGWMWTALVASFLAPQLAPQRAQAANAAIARTPPLYVRAACIAHVDRSVDPVFHLDVGVPFEDVTLSEDEPDDSRRFQFFAVCEDEHAEFETLPNWITAAEAEEALARGSLDEPAEAEDILETNTRWSGCAFPMMPSDARMPISCEGSRDGVDFDTTDLPAGNYVIRGYTYEPQLNLWSQRRGVVQVTDDATPLPAIGLSSPALADRIVRVGKGFPIRGCATGAPDAEGVLQWAALTQLGRGDDEAVWQTFATVSLGEGAFEVLFDPPADAENQAVLIRAVVDPDGPARWVDHAEGSLIVVGGDGDSAGVAAEPIEICGFYDEPFDPAPTAGELTGGADGSSSSGDGPGADAQTSGCNCVVVPQGRRFAHLWLLVLGTLLIRRKRG